MVGYQELGVTSSVRYNYIVSTFDKVGEGACKLGDIGVDENFGSSYLSFLNPNGTTKTFEIPEIKAEGGSPVFGFTYINAADAEEIGLEGPGWYYADGEYTFAYYSFNDLEVPAGSMFYIEAEADTSVIIPSAL